MFILLNSLPEKYRPNFPLRLAKFSDIFLPQYWSNC